MNEINFNPARPKQRSNYMLTNFVSNYDDLGRASIEHMIKNVETRETDYFDKAESQNFLNQIAYYLNMSNPIEWIFLTIFSIIVSIFLITFDSIIAISVEKRLLIASSSNQIFNFIFYMISGIIFLLLATSVGYFISADADGSGIPEMKTVLSGMNIYRYFSFNALIGKVIGLFAAITGGANVGKVGPFVHISCLICNRLMKINYFSSINKSTSSKNNMLAAAAAAGITLSLGTPLGGVLFSIESTASIYIVSNIWKSFFCSVICIFMAKLMSAKSLFLTNITTAKPILYNSELFVFIIQGLIGGVLGALLSTLIAKLVYTRRKSSYKFLNNRFRYAIIIASITSILTFFFVNLRVSDKKMINFMFTDSENLSHNLRPNDGIEVFIVFIFKFILFIICIAANIPAGIFGPAFCLGALYGRIFGYSLQYFIPTSDITIYAMVGAACVFSGFTHTVSSALIIFEMTGQTSYLAPLLLATLIANLTAQSLSMNIFDVLLVIKNLPYLPSIKSTTLYFLSANDIMSKVNYYLEIKNLNIINILIILIKLPKKYHYTIPIIDDKGIIRYTINVKSLFKYTFAMYENSKQNYTSRDQSHFNEYFSFIRKKFFSIKRSFFQQISYKFRKLYITLRDKQKLKLNKKFEEESSLRILTIFKENAADDNYFLSKEIDIDNKNLSADKSALTVDRNFPILKVQFLFTFLNISHIYVTDNGELTGIITKEDFIKKSMNIN